MELSVTAVCDANILHPAPLRDLFIRVEQARLVRISGERRTLRHNRSG